MEKDSALYQLMVVRMNGIMNDITNSDGEYQEIVWKSDEYSGRLERIGLPVDIRLLIDDYVSEQNALVSRYGISAGAFPKEKVISQTAVAVLWLIPRTTISKNGW